jgi:NAD-dependent dihydropyrimidine dehydrogenase PreA subunit
MAQVVVDPRRCEGKKTCAVTCPEGVFVMRRPEGELPWSTRIKVALHGGKQAFVMHEEACTACMKCIEVCPERAIRVTP